MCHKMFVIYMFLCMYTCIHTFPTQRKSFTIYSELLYFSMCHKLDLVLVVKLILGSVLRVICSFL